ncbi:MAG: hypothetical protein E7633_05210 [Ruminococcaceae bacterium]|nr:hypothetical protein [Oscillospiraceae bacterium]
MEKLENTESTPYVDPNEIKRPTSFKAWVENYWYHYKWHTIVAVFAVILGAMLVFQMATKEKYDIKVIYSGPAQLDGGELEKVSNAFTELLKEDLNGDGKINAITYGEYLLSPEQQKALEDEAKKQSIAENTEYVFLYTAENRNNALNNTNTLVAAGEAIICLMDKYNYDILRSNNAFATLEDILGYKPDFARDDYSVYLKDTDFGKYFESAFELLPEDTILCIRGKVVVGGDREYEEIYKGHTKLFEKIISFEIPK